jgi:hypothetical protein
MKMVKEEFKKWCGLPCVQGAIGETHIAIIKALGGFCYTLLLFQNKMFHIVAQSIIDCNKKFIDLYVHLHGLINDSCVLKKSTLYKCT